MSQRLLARRTGYSHSVVAAAETGRPHVSARFWQQADSRLNANGQLTDGHERVRFLGAWARQQGRDAGTGEGLPSGTLPGGVALAGERIATTPAMGVCPSCGHPLVVVAHLAVPAPQDASPPGP